MYEEKVCWDICVTWLHSRTATGRECVENIEMESTTDDSVLLCLLWNELKFEMQKWMYIINEADDIKKKKKTTWTWVQHQPLFSVAQTFSKEEQVFFFFWFGAVRYLYTVSTGYWLHI